MKAFVDDANKPTTISDAQIVQWVVDADAQIDTFTNQSFGFWGSVTYSLTVFDSGTDRVIQAASSRMAAATLIRRIVGEQQMGEKFVTGPISEDLATRQQEFLKLAQDLDKEAVMFLRQKISGFYGVERNL